MRNRILLVANSCFFHFDQGFAIKRHFLGMNGRIVISIARVWDLSGKFSVQIVVVFPSVQFIAFCIVVTIDVRLSHRRSPFIGLNIQILDGIEEEFTVKSSDSLRSENKSALREWTLKTDHKSCGRRQWRQRWPYNWWVEAQRSTSWSMDRRFRPNTKRERRRVHRWRRSSRWKQWHHSHDVQSAGVRSFATSRFHTSRHCSDKSMNRIRQQHRWRHPEQRLQFDSDLLDEWH